MCVDPARGGTQWMYIKWMESLVHYRSNPAYKMLTVSNDLGTEARKYACSINLISHSPIILYGIFTIYFLFQIFN